MCLLHGFYMVSLLCSLNWQNLLWRTLLVFLTLVCGIIWCLKFLHLQKRSLIAFHLWAQPALTGTTHLATLWPRLCFLNSRSMHLACTTHPPITTCVIRCAVHTKMSSHDNVHQVDWQMNTRGSLNNQQPRGYFREHYFPSNS